MKKIIVTLVAMMAVTFSFAETNSNNVDRRWWHASRPPCR